MELIKEELSVKGRKVMFTSETTGFSAFISPAHNGVVVAKLTEDNDGAIRGATSPTYHQDVPRAILHMSRLEADAGFVGGDMETRMETWLEIYNNSNEALIAKFEDIHNNN